jgi:hypothetical protein
LLRLLLDLEVNRFEFFSIFEVSFLSSEGLALFIKELSFDDLTEAIWMKGMPRLKTVSPLEL